MVQSVANSRPVFWRLLGAVAGGAGISACNLLATVFLLGFETQANFGLFAFSQVAIAFGYGVSNALFGAPLTVALNDPAAADKQKVAASFELVNLLLCLAGSVLLALILWSLEASTELSLLCSASALVHWMRWYCRAHRNALHEHRAVIASDGTYSIVVLLGLAILAWTSADARGVVCLQAVAALCGLVVLLGKRRAGGKAYVAPFLHSFRSNGRHALLGVLSTEVTTNAHAYLVTVVLGPTAFATIAAAQTFFRPVGVVISSVTQFELPRISTLLQRGLTPEGVAATWMLSRLLWAAWFGNLVVAWLAHGVLGKLLESRHYDLDAVRVALVLSAGVMGMRCLRASQGLLLQAAGHFKELSRVTVASGVIAAPVVLTLVSTVQAEWSLAGVLVSEAVCVVLMFRLTRQRFAFANESVTS